MSGPSTSNPPIPTTSPISPRARNTAVNAPANVPARGDKGKEKEGTVEERKKVQGGNVGAVEGVTSPGELTVFVDKLLSNLEAKFEEMSSDVLDRSESTVAYDEGIIIADTIPPFLFASRTLLLPPPLLGPLMVIRTVTQMSNRIDNLETSIQEIIDTSIDAAPPPHRATDLHRQVGNGGGEDEQSLLLVDQPHDISLVGEGDSG